MGKKRVRVLQCALWTASTFAKIGVAGTILVAPLFIVVPLGVTVGVLKMASRRLSSKKDG